MARVQWESISLKGFGPYREGIKVKLKEGLNILVAPNESGKSTLIAGLSAVLFGLPGISDPGKFGMARFRSWEGTESFEGEVVFTVDGEQYRVKRQFTSHQVEISREKEGQWQVELSLEHNPNAQKDAGLYRQYLHNLLGLSSADVFAASFYLEQPLPEGEQLSEHVQSLLSGSGSHFGKALDELAEELAELTKRVSLYGLPRDKNKNRKLENLQEQIEQLAQEIEQGRNTIEELQTTLVELAKLDEDLKQIKQIFQAKKALQQAWAEGRQLDRRYQEALEKQLELQESYKKVKELEEDIEQKIRQIDEELAVFHTAPADLGDGLDSLIGWEQERQGLEQELQKSEEQLVQRNTKFKLLTEELVELDSFQKNPRLLADFQNCISLHQQKQLLVDELEKLVNKKARCDQELSLLPAWGTFGEQPFGEVKSLRERSSGALRYWDQLKDYRRKLEAVTHIIESQYSCMLELTAAQEEALEEYTFQKLKLETELKEKENQWAKSQEEYIRHQEDKQRYKEEFAGLEGLEKAELEKMIALLIELKGLRTEEAGQPPQHHGLTTRFMLMGCGAVALASIGWFVGNANGLVLGLLLGLILGWGLGNVVFKGKQQDFTGSKVKEIKARLESLHKSAGILEGTLSEVELGSWLEKLRRSLLEQERLTVQERKLQNLDLEGLQAARDAARQRLDEFHALLAYQENCFGQSLPTAFAEFRGMDRRQKELKNKMGQLLKEEFQLEAGSLDRVTREYWPDFWRQLAILQELEGNECHHLEELSGWLRSLDAGWWQQTLESAGQWENIKGELKTLENREKELTATNEKGLTLLDEYEQELARLAANISPYTINTPAGMVERDACRYQELREELSGIQETVRQLECRYKELENKKRDLEVQIMNQRDIYGVYLAQGEGNPQTTKARWQTYQEQQQVLREQRGKLAGLLGGVSVEDSKELAKKLIAMENEARMLLGRLEELTARHPGLPSFTQTKDRQVLEQEYRQLEVELMSLERQEEHLKDVERELVRQQSRLEGKEPINLAQAELELEELRTKEALLQCEAKALGIAYQELKGAIQDYNYSYRERLAEQASLYFQQFTQSKRQVIISQDFDVRVLEQGQERLVSQFSQGTRDQLFLSLRLAIGDLLAEEMHLPFIYDDPFLNYDAKRLEEVKELLQSLALKRQIFFLSHREDMKSWGSPVTIVKG